MLSSLATAKDSLQLLQRTIFSLEEDWRTVQRREDEIARGEDAFSSFDVTVSLFAASSTTKSSRYGVAGFLRFFSLPSGQLSVLDWLDLREWREDGISSMNWEKLTMLLLQIERHISRYSAIVAGHRESVTTASHLCISISRFAGSSSVRSDMHVLSTRIHSLDTLNTPFVSNSCYKIALDLIRRAVYVTGQSNLGW